MIKMLQQFQKKELPVPTDNVLRAMKPEYVHVNDLHVVVDCLDDLYCKDFTRILALEHLAKRRESRKYLPKIKIAVEDLIKSDKYGSDAKELVARIAAKE
jgi:hypothetical protein